LYIFVIESLETGKVPSDWNHANVTPVLKKGDKHNPGNYRPISITCIACKLLVPKYFIVYSSLLCGTLSKAFAKSIIIKSVCIFLSLFCDNSCIKEIICDSHDRFAPGKVPSDWNHANVTPVLKKGDKHNPGNYRPISMTCIACKLLEHIFASNMMQHLETNNILYELQHGFRDAKVFHFVQQSFVWYLVESFCKVHYYSICLYVFVIVL
jgi:hypothetical protein